MENSKLRKVMKAAAHKFIIIYLALFLAMPVQALERVRYIHTDLLGSPAAATDEKGEVVWREYYRPYGERTLDSTDDNRIWFTGKLEQPNVGLNYSGARWYDPMVGRFTGIDPAGVDPGDFNTFNRYCYANNNPYRYVDPDGEFSIAEVAVATGLVILSYIIVADSMRNSTTFPSQNGGYNYYDSRSMEPGSLLSDPTRDWFPSLDWKMPTWMSSENRSGYIPPPKEIEGIDGLSPAKPKTPVQGGGGLRKRWKDQDGNIYEWDSQHGMLEKYNKRGRHQGEFDPQSGEQTKPPNKGRKVEP